MAFLYQSLVAFARADRNRPALEIPGSLQGQVSSANLLAAVDDLRARLEGRCGPNDIVGIEADSLYSAILATIAVDAVNAASAAVLPADNSNSLLTKILKLDAGECELRSLQAETAPPVSDEAAPQQHLARVIHTSGSTGTPTPLGFSDEIVEDRIRVYEENFGHLLPGDGEILSMMGLSSSLGYLLLCLSLRTKRLLVVFDGNIPFPEASEIRRFSVAFATPATLSEYWALDRSGVSIPFSVSNIVISGSAVSEILCRNLEEIFKSRVHILYGSAEVGLIAFGALSEIDLNTGEVGKIRNDCRVLSGPDKDAGCIYAAKFVAPVIDDRTRGAFSVVPGDEWHSSDLCSVDENGVLTFRGRRDSIANVGGLKIALSRIETAVSGFIGGGNVCALRVLDGLGLERIVLFVQPNGPLDRKTVAAKYREAFPPPLFPIQFVEVGRFPLKQNGKIDVQALKKAAARSLQFRIL